MNAAQLAVIKERAEKATPGPWELDNHCVYYGEENDDLICEMEKSFEDAEFIAHAREDIPALVAEVERLNDVKHRLHSENELLHKGREGDSEIVREQLEIISRLESALQSACNALGADISDYYEED